MGKLIKSLCFVAIALISQSECHAESIGEPVELQCGYVNPLNAGNGIMRLPRKIPSLYLCGKTLYFEPYAEAAYCLTITTNEGDEIIYNDIVAEGSCYYTIPDSIKGSCIITLSVGNVYYWGHVDL